MTSNRSHVIDDEMTKLLASSSNEDELDSKEASRYMASTIALCMCTLNNAWLLISVFPYSGYMAMDLIPGVNQENAGSYAGLISASFMIGRSLSSYGWGHMADTYGRTTVLQLSLALSCVFSLLFGLAPTFILALLWRFLLGLSNGIIGTAKTAVSELAKGNEKLETRGMGLVMGMWGWGFLVCPAFSGIIADPIRQYPSNHILELPWIRSVLSKYPFLLPYLVGATSSAITMIAVHLLVEETLDANERRSASLLIPDFISWLQSIFWCHKAVDDTSKPPQDEVIPLENNDSLQSYQSGVKASNRYMVWSSPMPSLRSIDPSMVADLDDDEEGDEDDAIRQSILHHWESTAMLAVSPRQPIRKSVTINSPSISLFRRRSCEGLSVRSVGGALPSATEAEAPPPPPPLTSEPKTLSSLLANVDTRNHLLVYWIYSFVSIQVDEAFPLFCISRRGGLGLTADKIGKILSGSGVVFAICQYFVYTSVVSRFGLYPSIHIGSFLAAPIITLIPLSLFLNRSGPDVDEDLGHGNPLTWSAFFLLITIMASYRLFGNIFFSSITVATNRTVPASQRATMNGLSMLGGSIAKSFGPAFAGFLVSFCLSSGLFSPRAGGVLIFAVIGFLGVAVAIVALHLLMHEPEDDDIEVSR